jgi:hypothetical protein
MRATIENPQNLGWYDQKSSGSFPMGLIMGSPDKGEAHGNENYPGKIVKNPLKNHYRLT